MATVMKSPVRFGRTTPVRTPTDRLHKDRITAVVVLALFATLLALMIWLTSLGGGSTDIAPMDWPMM